MNKFLKLWPFSIVIIFALTPLLWFYQKGNVLINGIDTNFPLDPEAWFMRRFSAWNDIGNAGSDFSSSTAGLFFHFIQFIPYKLGLHIQQVQIISLVFWFSLIVFGSYIFARVVFTKKPLVQLLFVSLYSFNIYLFNSWENVKVANLSLMASIPGALALLILLRQKLISKNLALLSSIFVGIILSGTGINPAYFASFFIIMIVFIFSELLGNFNKKFIIDRLKDLIIIFIPLLLVNLFWILPTAFFISFHISPSGSIDELGFTNWIDSLSENTSILNVLRFQGAWDWYPVDTETNTPYYIPYASSYFYKIPFILFSLLLPLLAFLSLLKPSKEKNGLYIAFGVMLVVGVFLGVGTHQPTGTFFRFLSNHLPFFTLFRSPWYIFTPIIIVGVSGLVSLLFAESNNFKIPHKIVRFVPFLTFFLITSIIIGNLFYSYPLISGIIFRPGRSDSFYVQFPDYVIQSKEKLITAPEGRIVSYPDAEVENFNWGYRGIETILQLLVDRETLFTPLNMSNSPIASILREFYLSLKKGEITAAESWAGKLNVGLIFNKKDQKVVSYDLSSLLKDNLTFESGQWVFYRFPEKELTPKIYASDDLFFSYPYQNNQPFFSALKSTDIVLNPEDNVVSEIPGIYRNSGSIVLAHNNQEADFRDYKTVGYFRPNQPLSDQLRVKDLTEIIYTVEFQEDKLYQPVLERYKLENFDVDVIKGMEVEINGKKDFWDTQSSDDSFVYFRPLFFSKGKYQIKTRIVNNNLVNGGNFNETIGFTRGGEGKGEGLYEVVEYKDQRTSEKKEKYLSITNFNKPSIAALFKLSSFDPLSNYYIEAKYRHVYGTSAHILVTQWDKDALVKVGREVTPNYPDWKVFSFYYEPVAAKSDLVIELTAPFAKNPFGTTVLFDDLKVYKVFSNKLMFINQSTNNIFSQPQVVSIKKSPVLYEVEIKGADKPHMIVFSENYSPFWKLTLYDDKGLKLAVKPFHFSANLYANAWYLEGTPQNYQVKISYFPQELLLLGLRITIFTAGSIILYSLMIYIRRRKFIP